MIDKIRYWDPKEGRYKEIIKPLDEDNRVSDGKKGWVSDNGAEFSSVDHIVSILDSGIYDISVDSEGKKLFSKITFPTDSAIALPGLPAKYILDQIKLFWTKASEYKKYNFVHKRGILLYGPSGCGKTSIIRLLCNDLIQMDGIVFMIDNFKTANQCISNFRKTEPTRPIMTLMEDIEGIFKGDNGFTQIQAALSFLDGQNQVDNIVHIATTNEPEGLADRFIKRPGRFDLVIGIHPPVYETREAYLRHVCGNQIEEEKLQEIAKKTEGLGLSYLRELTSTYLCLDIPLDETLNRLKENFKSKKLKNKEDNRMGFSIGYNEE